MTTTERASDAVIWETLKGKRVIIVGGSSGIGLGAAALLARLGAAVTIAGRDPDRLQHAASTLDHVVQTEQIDGKSPASVEAMFARAGPFDHLVITLTGKLGAGPFSTLDLDELRQAFEEKFWAHLTIAKASLGTLSRQGSLTFVTGISARKPNPGGSGFAAINGALEIMTPALASELAPLPGERSLSGADCYPLVRHLPEEERRSIYESAARQLPVGRVGHPDDVAQALLYVIATGFVTGSVIECDGGARLAL